MSASMSVWNRFRRMSSCHRTRAERAALCSSLEEWRFGRLGGDAEVKRRREGKEREY
jgi:hypothetical protein